MRYIKFSIIDDHGFETKIDEENIGTKLVLREKNEHTLQVYLKDISDNLILLLHLENNGIDESGYDNHAIVNGTFVNAKIGNGVSLNGIDEYLVINNSNRFTFKNREPFSVSFWIKPSEILNRWSRIVSKEEYNNLRQGWLIFLDPNGRIGFERWRDNINEYVQSQRIISIDEFTHITCTYDGIKLSIYINGILDNTNTSTLELRDNNSDLVIGASSFYSDHFKGIIDEIRIYNRSLTQDEVKKVYESKSKSIRIFEGIIIYVEEIGEFNKTISINARDLFKDRLLTKVINKRYIDMKVSDIFKDIISQLGEEFSINGVKDVNIIISKDFPYLQAQLACDTLAEDTGTEYFCKPNLDCVFRELKTDDSKIVITEDMVKSPAEIKRSYADSISEVIVVGGFDENNNRVIARAVNHSLSRLKGRTYVLHDKSYTDYSSAKLRALSILNKLSKLQVIIEPIYVKQLDDIPLPGQLVTLNLPKYGLNNTKVIVKELEINAKPGIELLWFKLSVGESEESLESKIVTQQHLFEKNRVLGTTFNDLATHKLDNIHEPLILNEKSKTKRCKGFYLDYVLNYALEGLEFGLDGKYASQLDL